MKTVFTNLSLYFLVFYFALSLPAIGQTLINGKVTDETNNPFSFANVLLLNAPDSALVKGMLSDENGSYRFENIKPGGYLISISAVGHKQVYSKFLFVEATKPTVQVITLVMVSSNKNLQEVAVIAAKPLFEQHLDKLVVNLQNSITAAGGTALDVLERSPGVSINRQNNTIALSGKTGVVVMVNGKITRLPMQAVMQMLNGMNAGNIEKIELITTPSARNDAEGNAGMINIITIKNTDVGTNGSFTATVGYGWYKKAAASANLNHRTAKLNLFGDGTFAYDHFMFQINNNRRITDQNKLIENNTVSKRYTYSTDYNSRIGFDYTLSSKTTLGGLLSGYSNKWDQFCHNNTNIVQSDETVTRVYMNDHEINHWRNLMGNLNLRHTMNNSQEIIVDIDYLFYYHNNPHWYKNKFNYLKEKVQEENQVNNSKVTPIHMWVGKADYVSSLGKNSKLETGVKGTLSRLNNNVAFVRLIDKTWQFDPEFSQNVKMKEDIAAAYANFQHQLNVKTKLQTGLRWEYTYTNLVGVTDGQTLINRRYHKLFPSVFLSHALSQNHDFQLSYSKRITRPTFNDLAPFFTFLDPYTSITGNTALRPTITNALQATFQLKKDYLFSVQYSHDTNGIAWIARVDPERNEQFFITENIESVNTYALSLNFPVTVTPWWQMQNNIMGNWQQNKTRYQEQNVKISGGSGRINTTQNFTLPKKFFIELALFYQSRAIQGISYLKPSGYVNAGIQKKLKNNRGSFRLNGSDLFWTQRFRIVNNNPELNQDLDFTFKFEPRVFRLTYSHNFGNKGLKEIKRRSTGSKEERQRVTN